MLSDDSAIFYQVGCLDKPHSSSIICADLHKRLISHHLLFRRDYFLVLRNGAIFGTVPTTP